MRIRWLFLQIGGPVCGCLYDKRPTIWVPDQGQRVHVMIWCVYLGLECGPISLLWGLCIYYKDTWTLWVALNIQSSSCGSRDSK